MFRVTGEDGVLIVETGHKPTAEQSKAQYEGSMGKKATLIDLDAVEPKKGRSIPFHSHLNEDDLAVMAEDSHVDGDAHPAEAKTEQVSAADQEEESISDR